MVVIFEALRGAFPNATSVRSGGPFGFVMNYHPRCEKSTGVEEALHPARVPGETDRRGRLFVRGIASDFLRLRTTNASPAVEIQTTQEQQRIPISGITFAASARSSLVDVPLTEGLCVGANEHMVFMTPLAQNEVSCADLGVALMCIESDGSGVFHIDCKPQHAV
jgi:hypothetical protein